MVSHNSCISSSYTTIYLNSVVKKEIKKVKSNSHAFYTYLRSTILLWRQAFTSNRENLIFITLTALRHSMLRVVENSKNSHNSVYLQLHFNLSSFVLYYEITDSYHNHI